MIDERISEAVRMLRTAEEVLLTADLSGCSGVETVELAEALETHGRRMSAMGNRVVVQLERCAAAGDYGRTSTADLLCQRLRITPGEAKARVTRAAETEPRRTLTGEPLPPLLPATADGVRAGEISTAHVSVISRTMQRIPHTVSVEASGVAERLLAEAARHEHPRALERTAALLLYRLDPDGREPREAELERHRELTLTPRGDGSARVRGELTPECTATWQVILDALAAPRSAAEGMAEDRTPGQRRHDALLEAGQRLLRSDTLPAAGGSPVTVLIRTTAADLTNADGLATTGTGETWPLTRLRPLLGEAALIPVTVDPHGAVLSFGRTRRLASKAQRLALAARDGGCCFPGCARPAAWTEVHHVIAWDAGGTTDLDNLCLVCRWHHRQFAAHGWRVEIRHGVPQWIPPPWLDATQTPIRNTSHHPPELDFGYADTG